MPSIKLRESVFAQSVAKKEPMPTQFIFASLREDMPLKGFRVRI